MGFVNLGYTPPAGTGGGEGSFTEADRLLLTEVRTFVEQAKTAADSAVVEATAAKTGVTNLATGTSKVTLASVTHTGAVIPAVSTVTGTVASVTAGVTLATGQPTAVAEAVAAHGTIAPALANMDSPVSGVSTGGLSLVAIADAVAEHADLVATRSAAQTAAAKSTVAADEVVIISGNALTAATQATAAAQASQAALTASVSADTKLTATRLAKLDGAAQSAELPESVGLTPAQESLLTTAANQATAAVGVATAVNDKLTTPRLAKLDGAAQSAEIAALPTGGLTAGQATELSQALAAAQAAVTAAESVDGKLTTPRLLKLEGAAQSTELSTIQTGLTVDQAADLAAARAAAETAVLAAESADGKLTAARLLKLDGVAQSAEVTGLTLVLPTEDQEKLTTAAADATAAKTTVLALDAKITAERLAKLDGAAQSVELPATVGGLTTDQATALSETREWAERAAREAAQGGKVLSHTTTKTVTEPTFLDGTPLGGTREIKRSPAGVEIEVTPLVPPVTE